MPPAFIAQLGDIIDGVNSKLGQSETSLAAALAELRRAPCPVVNLVGNHELYNFNGDCEYYAFRPAVGWRVVDLDPYQIASIGHVPEDPRLRAAVDLLADKNPGVDP